MIFGAEPEEFNGYFNGTALVLYARRTRIQIMNWCKSMYYRLHQMEFMISMNRQPIVIQDLEQLQCSQVNNNNSNFKLITILKKKFINAQKQLNLINYHDDNDRARLMQCVGLIVTGIIAQKSVYELFGFTSIIEQTIFIHNNCKKLFTPINLQSITFTQIKRKLENKIELFQLNYKLIDNDKILILLIRERFDKIHRCWKNIRSGLYLISESLIDLANNNITSVNILDNITHLMAPCLPELIK